MSESAYNSSWSLYDPVTGLFSGRTFGGPRHMLAAHVPAGEAAIEGKYDHLSQRVDLTDAANPKVVDWRPPAPSTDHEWNAATKRWQLSATAIDRHANHTDALARIAALESSQARAVREHLLGNAEGTKRLQTIEAQITSLRGSLSS